MYLCTRSESLCKFFCFPLPAGGRVLRLEKSRVEAVEKEVSDIEQQLKEARRRLTSMQETAARASMEEREALVSTVQPFPGEVECTKKGPE